MGSYLVTLDQPFRSHKCPARAESGNLTSSHQAAWPADKVAGRDHPLDLTRGDQPTAEETQRPGTTGPARAAKPTGGPGAAGVKRSALSVPSCAFIRGLPWLPFSEKCQHRPRHFPRCLGGQTAASEGVIRNVEAVRAWSFEADDQSRNSFGPGKTLLVCGCSAIRAGPIRGSPKCTKGDKMAWRDACPWP